MSRGGRSKSVHVALTSIDSSAARARLRSAPTQGAAPYDFRRPTKLSREHTRTLQMSYEVFARRLTTQLTSGLRQVCQVSLVAIEQQSYEEYIAGLANTTLVSVLTMEPLPGTAILEFSVPTALACVDYLLGGPGGEQPTRTLTDIETTLLKGVIDQMLGVLKYALEANIGADPILSSIEYNPQFVQTASGTDTMVVGSFEMRIGSQVCLATLCIPFASLLPKLPTGRDKRGTSATELLAHEKAANRIRAAIAGTPIDVVVQFESVTLTPAQIMALVPGDVVPLGHGVTTPLAVEAGGQTFAYALAGRQGSRLAGLVVGTPREKNS
jgi:flagellar motor switch protein FliM